MEQTANAAAPPTAQITAMRVCLRCSDFDASLRFYTEVLGMRVAMIMPADAPTVAWLEGAGLNLVLEQGAQTDGSPLRLVVQTAEDKALSGTTLRAPEGTEVVFQSALADLRIPAAVPALLISRSSDLVNWSIGRAGMHYRELIPGRWGGRYVGSQIRIEQGGPVPDYVHYHHVRFQMIYCRRGWARLVYEDQGEAFLFSAGDCVLQPPQIRHRVLEASAGLEVVELGCPAVHPTFGDGSMALPTSQLRPERLFHQQRFVHHRAAAANWCVEAEGLCFRDCGIAAATGNLADVRVWRSAGAAAVPLTHHADLRFLYLLAGRAELVGVGTERAFLSVDDVLCVPPGAGVELVPDAGCEWLQVDL